MKDKEILRTLVHDARAPLNRISMNAELIKLILENDMPKDKALLALDKIINNCHNISVSISCVVAIIFIISSEGEQVFVRIRYVIQNTNNIVS